MEGLAGDLIHFASTGKGECPPSLGYLLEWFGQLLPRRSVGMAANPLSHMEVEAWARNMEVRPTPWEISILFRMDDAVVAKANKTEKEKPVHEGPKALEAMLMSFNAKKGGGGKSRSKAPNGKGLSVPRADSR